MKKLIITKKRLLFVIFPLLFIGLGLAGFSLSRLGGNDDCTSVEKFDFWRNECFFECDSDEECATLSQKVDQELNEAYKDSKYVGNEKLATKPSADRPTGPSTGVKPDGGTLYNAQTTGSETKGAIYTVQSDASLQPNPSAEHSELWSLFVGIIGKQTAIKSIASFEVYSNDQDTSAASVWRSQNPYKWHMNLNAAYKDDKKDLVHTLVHEYGHVVTLSGNQVSEVDGACPRLQLAEGCASQGSYIQKFYAKFWEPNGDNPDQQSKGDSSEFVSEYASSNLGEDMAESWAYFVLRAKPVGDEVREDKVRFFYDFPELVSLRDRLRAAIGNDLVHSRKLN